MLHRGLSLAIPTLAVGAWLTGCAPVAAPPAPPGIGPGLAPGWNWVTGALACLTPLLIGLVVILMIAALLSIWKGKQSILQSSAPTTPPSAREIVRTRYARGEIDRQEYQRLLQDIEVSERQQVTRKEATQC